MTYLESCKHWEQPKVFENVLGRSNKIKWKIGWTYGWSLDHVTEKKSHCLEHHKVHQDKVWIAVLENQNLQWSRSGATGGESVELLGGQGWGEQRNRENNPPVITAQPPTWTWSRYFKLGQAHPIARDFIIHPFILIMEWNVQLIAPKHRELALTCLPTHFLPPHTYPPCRAPKIIQGSYKWERWTETKMWLKTGQSLW